MSQSDNTQYFDLHTTGLGYVSRIREVRPESGQAFLSLTLSALRGPVDNAQYTFFDCRVAGRQAEAVMRDLQPAVDAKQKVLIGFTLSDLTAETFTFKTGDKAGQTGVSLKARLLRVTWAKVDGESVYQAPVRAA